MAKKPTATPSDTASSETTASGTTAPETTELGTSADGGRPSLLTPAQLRERQEAHPMAVPFLWLGKKSVEDNFIWIPVAGLVITTILGLVYPLHHKAPWDFFGSWAIIGFVAYSFVVLSAEPLFRFLSRDEDYYGEDVASEETDNV